MFGIARNCGSGIVRDNRVHSDRFPTLTDFAGGRPKFLGRVRRHSRLNLFNTVGTEFEKIQSMSSTNTESYTSMEYSVRDARDDDAITIAHHFYKLWVDNKVPQENVVDDFESVTLEWLENAKKRDIGLKSWMVEAEGKVVGSITCQLFDGLYPLILKSEQRKYGYIWGLFVEEQYRRKGIAKALMEVAKAHLKSLNCSHIVLHASPIGKPLYEKLGFEPNNEMRLTL